MQITQLIKEIVEAKGRLGKVEQSEAFVKRYAELMAASDVVALERIDEVVEAFHAEGINFCKTKIGAQGGGIWRSKSQGHWGLADRLEALGLEKKVYRQSENHGLSLLFTMLDLPVELEPEEEQARIHRGLQPDGDYGVHRASLKYQLAQKRRHEKELVDLIESTDDAALEMQALKDEAWELERRALELKQRASQLSGIARDGGASKLAEARYEIRKFELMIEKHPGKTILRAPN